MEKQKLIKIDSLTQRIVLRRLGIFCTERLAINDFELLKCVNLLIPSVGEEWLEKQYEKKGKKWKDVKEDLRKLEKRLLRAKVFYDSLADKSFKKIHNSNTIEGAINRVFRKNVSKISPLQPTLYELFVMIVKNSEIQRSKIPSDSLKILEHVGMRKMLITKKPERANYDDVTKKD